MIERSGTRSDVSFEIDLRDLGSWHPQPPKGWLPVAEVCGVVRRGLENLTNKIVDAAITEIPSYAVVPRNDLTTSVYRNVEMMLLGIAEHRGPREQELSVRRELGRRRAAQGLPLHSLVGAYHIGYRELWAALVEQAKASGPEAQTLLLEGSATVWGWIHAVTTAVVDEYNKESARRAVADAQARTRFIELLIQDPESEAVQTLALGLGFRPEGRFQAVAVHTSDEGADLTEVRHALDSGTFANAVVSATQRGGTWIALVQSSSALPIERILSDVRGGAGIGLERTGLVGARLSIVDAERALEVAVQPDDVQRFEDVWLEATVLAQRGALAQMLEPGIQLAAKRPDLADTIRAFASSNLSLAAAARRLHLAPNSVRQRLNRWRAETGWDPWTVDGINRSTMAVRLAARTAPPS